MDTHDFSAMARRLDKLNGLEDPIGAVKSLIYVTQTLIGDGFMVRRLDAGDQHRDNLYCLQDLSRIRCLGSFLESRCHTWFYPLCRRRSARLFSATTLKAADGTTYTVLGYVTSFLGKDAPAGCINAFFVWSFVTNMMSSGKCDLLYHIAASYADSAHRSPSSSVDHQAHLWFARKHRSRTTILRAADKERQMAGGRIPRAVRSDLLYWIRVPRRDLVRKPQRRVHGVPQRVPIYHSKFSFPWRPGLRRRRSILTVA